MAYKDSYVYKIRQKVGNATIITATVDIIPISEDGKIHLVYSKDFDYWTNVGGHAELGDSWLSAAQTELAEESGIHADPESLTLFATISGPGRIFHYQDGDTQPFSLCFFVETNQINTSPTDAEEISQTCWATLSEIAQIPNLNHRTKLLLDALEKYQKTHKVQMITEE